MCKQQAISECTKPGVHAAHTPAVPPIGPGAMPLTRMPKAPHSSARLRVRLSTAALAADACA